MPRPKRSKVAPSAPAPRVAKSTKSATEPVPKPRATETALNSMYEVSDLDEGMVTSARRVKRDNGKGKAVAGREQTSESKTIARDLGREDSLSEPGESRIGKSHGSAKRGVEGTENIDLESSSPAMEVGRRERSMPPVENSLLALGNFKRRPRQSSILGRAAARSRSSSVESNLAQDTGLTSIGRQNNSVLENRQSRQPSATRRTTGNHRSSSTGLGGATPAHGGSIFNLGTFRKRPRQPSILGTAQKERQARPEYDVDEEDFNPEDESTPLNLSMTRDMTNSSSASNPRKRKLSAGRVLHSSPPIPSEDEMEEPETIPATGSTQHEEVVEDESQSSDEAPLPSIEPEDADPEPMSETMAPPMSSSPTPESPPSYRAARRLRAERGPPRGPRLRDRTPPPANQDSPISSPPSLTHSPNLQAAKTAPKAQSQAKKQAPARSTLSTAQLQALLPQRRRRGLRDPFDMASSEDEIDISGLASDDDELTHSTVRAPPSRRSVVARIPPSGRASRKAKATPAPKPGTKQTYDARAAPTTSDKENEEVDPDDSLAPLPDDEVADGSPEMEKRVGKELKRAARKFEQVDKWELQFEDCTASSSSPKDAR